MNMINNNQNSWIELAKDKEQSKAVAKGIKVKNKK